MTKQKSLHPKGQISARLCEGKIITPNLFVRKSHPYMFEISFISPSVSSKRIIWAFAVFSEEQLDKWIKILSEEKQRDLDKESRDKEAQRLLDDQISKELLQRKLREESKMRVNEIENKQKAKLREKEFEENRKKLEVDYEIKRLQQEAEEKRQKELAIKRREKYEKLLEYSWDYQFQKLWTRLLQQKITYEENLTYGILLYKHLGQFSSKAIEISKVIISEFVLSEFDRQLHPVLINDIFQYRYQNMLIQVVKKSKSDLKWKSLADEFRANSWFFDNLYVIGKKQKKFNFRVPLMCLVDYQGHRVLVSGIAPVENERTLIHGPKSDGVYVANQGIYQNLSVISEEIRVQEHKFEWNETVGPAYVHLSAFTECHKSLGYRDLEEYIQESLGKNEESLPLEDYIYLYKLGNVFPVDHHSLRHSVDFSLRLRPEFLKLYKAKLSPDSFISIHSDSKKHEIFLITACKYLRNTQVPKLVKDLDCLKISAIDSESLTQTVHRYGVNLRYLGLIADLTTLPHIRQIVVIEILARTCKNIFFQHLSEFISSLGTEKITEKSSFLRTNTMINGPQIRPQKKTLTHHLLGNRNTGIFHQVSPINNLYNDSKLLECAAEFFNIVFGKGKESDLYWKEILIPTAQKYQVNPSYLQKNSINLNALLHAMVYHCSIDLKFTNEIVLGQSTNPFEVKDFTGFSHKINIYKMNTLEYYILAEKSEYFKKCKNFTLALQSCELKRRISKALNIDNNFGDALVLSEIGEILLETKDIESAMQKAKQSLVQIHPFHINCVRNWMILTRAFFHMDLPGEAKASFENAVAVLNFHWGNLHPYHSKLHLQLGEICIQQEKFSDALVLYKNALSCCFQVLGPTHIYTGKAYIELSKYYCLMHRYDEALAASEKAYLNFFAFYGEDSIQTISSGVLFAEVSFKLGRYSQAEKIIEKACVVYNEVIQGNDLNAVQEEMKEILNQFYAAVIIGMKISLKKMSFLGVLEYSEKIWMLSKFFVVKGKILLKALKVALDAKLNLIGQEKKVLVMKGVYLHKIGDEEIGLVQDVLRSERFKEELFREGGIGGYLDRLINDAVSILNEKRGDFEKSKEQVFSEIKAILEIPSN